MPVEDLEERRVEVLGLPPGVDEDLLHLYFENKRRSGGGPLVSFEKKGDNVLLVFEEAEAAAQVLSKGHHVLHNAELTVRKPAPKDRCSLLLLRGINPNTCLEMIELYVENMIGLDAVDYTLSPAPGRDFIFIHLSQPLSKDFEDLNARISRRKLDGAAVSLEQMEQTDSVFVENLHPGTTTDQLTLYFESQAGGNQMVKEVTMLSEGVAKVSFVNYDTVGLVLSQLHKFHGSDLVVMPYSDFLQPTQSVTPQESGAEGEDITEGNSEDLSDAQAIPPTVFDADSQSSSERASELPTTFEAEEELIVDETEDIYTLPDHLSITDPVKLALFKLSTFQKDIEKTNPNIQVQIDHSGVTITGLDRQTRDQVGHSILDYFSKMAKARFTLEPEKAEFLSRKDVKERLQQTMSESGSPAMYTVLDSNVTVTALTQDSANQACSFLKSQPHHFSMQVDSQSVGLMCCREWTDFLQALGFSSVKFSQLDGTVDVLTLKGMEGDKKTAILEFLSTPIERETLIAMEPGKLKYLQIHHHQLLADMDQVSIYPVEADDVCGLKIHGQAVACQIAEEVLREVISTICTKTITIEAPGVTRYLCEEECKTMLKTMETKFEVYIIIKQQPWEPLPQQDIFQNAWTMMSHVNFPRVSPDTSIGELKSVSVEASYSGAASRDLLDEAMTIVSSFDGKLNEGASNSEQLYDLDDLDLYTDEEPTSTTDQSSGVLKVDAPQSAAVVNSTSGLPHLNGEALGRSSSLEEEAQLSLAIQYSMEVSHLNVKDEEKQLQEALELSKKMVRHEASSTSDQLKNGSVATLEDTVKAANSIQFVVFAVYLSDLTRVDIAFKKRVGQKQAEEKLEHRTLAHMSEYHKKCLEMIKRKHGVEIQVQGTTIIVSGFSNYVTEALCDVKLLLDRMSTSASGKEILRVVQWVFHDPVSSNAIPYSPDVTVFIENVWRMKLNKVDILLDNQLCRLNLETMQEYNMASGKSIKISRKLVDLGDIHDDVPEEEYSLLSNLPDATKVDEDSDEFQTVVKRFYETIKEYHSKIRIIQVEKLMNRLLYNQYKLKKASVLQRATYPEVERTLYHGTSEESVKEICIHGFNRSFCGKNATVYGQGVYFAINSALSVKDQYSPPNKDGYKFIFMAKVLTGDFTKGCHSMKTAPLKETGDIPLRFDSVTDNMAKPSMFVIFNDTQAFPEYLITCQKIGR